MKSLLWKEFRENIRWAVPALVAVSVAFAWSIGAQIDRYPRILISGGADFQDVVPLASGVVGFLLGLLQTLPEARRERWGLLVHRPMSRTAIFWGKASVGLALYVAALGIPFLLASWWLATPGRIAGPFRASMMVPGMADILTGVVYYFAGMLTGTREARWYASKGAGIAVALCCSFIVINHPHLDKALLALALGTGLLAAATWSSFVAGGRYPSQARVGKFAIGVILLIAVVMAGAGVIAINGFWVFPQTATSTRIDYKIFDDGEVLVATHRNVTQGLHRRTVSYDFRDLDGKVIATDSNPAGANELAMTFMHIGGAVLRRESLGSYRNGFGIAALHERSSGRPSYYLQDEGLIAVYDPDNHGLLGYIGPEGGLRPKKPAVRFRGDGVPIYRRLWSPWDSTRHLLQFDEAVYLYAGPLSKVFSGEPVISVAWGTAGRDERGRREPPEEIVIATPDRVRVVASTTGKVLLDHPLPRDREALPYLQVGRLEDGRRVVSQATIAHRARIDSAVEIVRIVQTISTDGTVERELELPPLKSESTPRWTMHLLGLVLPPVGAVIMAVDHWISRGWDYMFTTEPFHPNSWVLLLLTLAASMALTLHLARRNHFSGGRRCFWLTLTLLLGPMAPLALLCLEEWPAREECASCGKHRLVTGTTCESCGGEWPALVPDGTEIFET